MTGWGKSTLGAQPAIVPSSVAKRNRLGPDLPSLVTTNPLPPLNTIPVGAPPPSGSSGVGIETTSGVPGGAGVPEASYSVDVLLWLFATHQNASGLKAMPHGFFKF